MSVAVVVAAVAVAAVVVVVCLVRRARDDERRTRDAEAFAAAQGWRYQRVSAEHGDRYLGHPCGVGEQRRGEHVMLGRYRGEEVAVAEHVCEVGGADGRATLRRCLVVSLAMPAARPTVQVEPRRRAGSASGPLPLQEVTLGRSDLDRAFRVSADDEAFAHAVLVDTTADWMLQDPRLAHVPVRLERADLLVWREGPLRLHLVLPLLDLLVEVRDRIPATLCPRGGSPAG